MKIRLFCAEGSTQVFMVKIVTALVDSKDERHGWL